jgi:hypothetical protein
VGVIRHSSHRIKPQLAPAVKQRLEELYAAGTLPRDALDERCMDALLAARPSSAVAAIDKLASRNMSEVGVWVGGG